MLPTITSPFKMHSNQRSLFLNSSSSQTAIQSANGLEAILNSQIRGHCPLARTSLSLTNSTTAPPGQSKARKSWKPFSFLVKEKKKSLTNYTLSGPHFSASYIVGVLTLVHQFQTLTLLHVTTITPAPLLQHLATKNSFSSSICEHLYRTAQKVDQKRYRKKIRTTVADVISFLLYTICLLFSQPAFRLFSFHISPIWN